MAVETLASTLGTLLGAAPPEALVPQPLEAATNALHEHVRMLVRSFFDVEMQRIVLVMSRSRGRGKSSSESKRMLQ